MLYASDARDGTSATANASACLEEYLLAGFVAGTLDAAALAVVEAHLQACGSCFAVVGALAGDEGASQPRSSLGASDVLEERFQAQAADGMLPARPGQIFAERYRIDRFLAKGGHGAVFAAQHLATEAPVALKLLWPHALSSAPTSEALALEAKVATRAKSEFTVH